MSKIGKVVVSRKIKHIPKFYDSEVAKGPPASIGPEGAGGGGGISGAQPAPTITFDLGIAVPSMTFDRNIDFGAGRNFDAGGGAVAQTFDIGFSVASMTFDRGISSGRNFL